ncbi:hypothetical protein KIW84_012808 [Lathyrus oleraceus]|uniref:Pol polyprotein n=1 Tax=Pisum sativum TaxID=3888 RepID=A0A9D5BIS2_PEA|nr:hypothetical protein KIW84_012808 [Pisum sativum]
MWGIDMIGMIEPKASNGHCFILVAIDYFIKWVKAASYANVIKQVVVRFIKNQIICRYGVPRATPFSLVYGIEAVLSVEVEIPSLRVLMKAKLNEAEWCQTRFDQLNLIEEKILTAMCHGQLYQQRMKKAFDKKVRPRVFREGDLVLKRILSFKPDSRGK